MPMTSKTTDNGHILMKILQEPFAKMSQKEEL